MTVTLNSSGITFQDGSSQSTQTHDGTGSDRGTPVSITSFTSSGTYTVPSNAHTIIVQCIGGGGGSCGYCESGGAGGFAEGMFSVSPGAQYGVTIGGGGGAAGYYSGAGNGGTTSFGSLISASGGYGANQNYSHGGGHGGSGSGGQINLTGSSGTGHANHCGHAQNGRGGDGFFGGSPGKTRGQTWGNFSGVVGSGAAGDRCNDGHHGDNGIAGLVLVYAFA